MASAPESEEEDGSVSKSIIAAGGTVTFDRDDGEVTIKIAAPHQPCEMSTRPIAYPSTRGIFGRIRDFLGLAPLRMAAAGHHRILDGMSLGQPCNASVTLGGATSLYWIDPRILMSQGV